MRIVRHTAPGLPMAGPAFLMDLVAGAYDVLGTERPTEAMIAKVDLEWRGPFVGAATTGYDHHYWEATVTVASLQKMI